MPVETAENNDFVPASQVEDAVREASEKGASKLAMHLLAGARMATDGREALVEAPKKPLGECLPSLGVPRADVSHISLRGWREPDLHFLRFRASRISSQGRVACGLA